MNTENINKFDELMRAKLNSYEETEPDMDLFANIQSRKNRFLRLKNLYTLIFLLAIISAGIVGGFSLKTKSTNQSLSPNKNAVSKPANGATSLQQKQDKNALSFNYKHNQNIGNTNSVVGSINNVVLVSNDKNYSDLINQSNLSANNNNINQTVISNTNNNKVALNNTNSDNNNQTETTKLKETNGCNVDIDYYTTYDNGFNFIAKTNNSNVQLTWQFGDGKTSKENTPKHIYQKAGQYAVILTAIDKTSKCKAESSRLITVTKGVDLTASSISGTVFADAEYAAKTLVELLTYNIKTNQFEKTQAAYTNNNGYYQFEEVVEGNYIIKTGNFKAYSTTYYGNTVDKEYANSLTIFANDYKQLFGYDIQMVNHQANAAINKNNTDTGGKWMLVLDANNNPIASVLVSANGTVQSNTTLPSGNYNLMDPSTGKTTKNINVEGNKLSLGDVGNNNSASQSGFDPEPELVLMPNPATENVKVSLNPSNNTPIAVSIVNSQGALMQSFTLNSGSSVNNINISSLPAGTYYVIAKQNGKTTSTRLVKTIDSSK